MERVPTLKTVQKNLNAAATATADVSPGGDLAAKPDGGETAREAEKVSGILTDAATLLKTLKPTTKAVKVKRWSFGWTGNKCSS